MKPNVGMKFPVYAPVNTYTPGTSISYSTGAKVAEARSATINWDRADAEFYGDDALLDVDMGARGGTIDFEPTGISDAVRAALLGETVANTSEYSITDQAAPYVGFGFIRVMRDDSSGTVVTNYEAWWFHRVQFALTTEEARTKEKDIEWRTPTLNGKIVGVSLDSSGVMNFATHETFSGYDAAESWLKSKAGIT